MIVKPTEQFTEDEKLKIDQFVMHGGKLLCFIDNLIAEQDSLSFKPETIAYDRNLNLADLFFKYGLRINTDLVMDLQCDLIPFVVGGASENPQIELLPNAKPCCRKSIEQKHGICKQPVCKLN
jgi:ABC-2 type transport system permease protein